MDSLRVRRQAAGLTLGKLSRLSGVNRATLSMAESRNLSLLPRQQEAIDKVLEDYARMRLQILQRMAIEKMTAEQ